MLLFVANMLFLRTTLAITPWMTFVGSSVVSFMGAQKEREVAMGALRLFNTSAECIPQCQIILENSQVSRLNVLVIACAHRFCVLN